jgi:hypothetical protein
VLSRRRSIAQRRPPAARAPKRPRSRPVALQEYRGRESNPHGRRPRRSRRRASTVPPPRWELLDPGRPFEVPVASTRPRSGRVQGLSRCPVAARWRDICGQTPGQGIEPRSPRSERGVLPVRRSRTVPLRPAPDGRSTQRHCFVSSDGARHHVPNLLCLCHSPTLRPWIVGREHARPRDDVIVEGLWSPSLVRRSEMCRQKLTLMPRCNSSAERRGVFLSQAGPRFVLELVQAEHHLLVARGVASRNDEGDPVGSPSTGFAMRLEA